MARSTCRRARTSTACCGTTPPHAQQKQQRMHTDKRSLERVYGNRAVCNIRQLALDNTDFEKSDIPFDFAMPERPAHDEAKREAIKEWVLEVSLDQSVDPQLENRPCEKCNTPIYVGSVSCFSCHNASPSCVVTGYPVLRTTKVNCRGCGRAANKEEWNRYLVTMSACPWCGVTDSPVF
mmetsp:Transcript_14630/g.34407  ORF Transcript_14630/g.34407 Transcript_14630/m.34407 type:complete len:179 (+) Transcript_14630:247-783(+)